jgi:hypothetical protein
MSDEQRIQAVCKSKAGLVDSNQDIWTVVGEWTPANTGKLSFSLPTLNCRLLTPSLSFDRLRRQAQWYAFVFITNLIVLLDTFFN